MRRFTLFTLCAALCGAAVPVLATLPAPAQAATAENTLVPTVTRQSLLGTHQWFQPTYRGVPVLGAYYVRHVAKDGRVSIGDGRRAVSGLNAEPRVTAEQAGQRATARTARAAGTRVRRTELAVLPAAGASGPRLVWSVTSRKPGDVLRTLVDAHTGQSVRTESLVKRVNGSGQAFDPNPVVTSQNSDLVDGDNKDSAALDAAYRQVLLTGLDGSGFLRGTAANNTMPETKQARSEANQFFYPRSDERFEQVSAYYGITKAQRYIQSLGFADVNNEPQKFQTNTFDDDNSFYAPNEDQLEFGTGGVDDAEDLEVVWHEYGHAVQDAQVPGFGSSRQAGAIGEAFGDYLAVTLSQANSVDTVTTPWACVMDWDATAYTSDKPHCLRRTDTNLTMKDANGQVHHDGQIWSRALWDINRAFDRDLANRIIIEAQFQFTPDTTFSAAAKATVQTAVKLVGAERAQLVAKAFTDREIVFNAHES